MKDLLINFKTISDNKRGNLSFFEGEKDIPFQIKRVYYIGDVMAATKRGFHAHKKLKQVLWCPYGEIEVLLDNGIEKRMFSLDSPEKALLVLEGYWHDMYWKKDGSVLCVAASDYYDDMDYIRDYDEFLKYAEKGYWRDEN